MVQPQRLSIQQHHLLHTGDGSFAAGDLRVSKRVNPFCLCSKLSPLSMKSMTVNELFNRLQLPPSWLDVCRLESSFSKSELSPSLAFFDLLLFFFEDMFIVTFFLHVNVQTCVNTERCCKLPG